PSSCSPAAWAARSGSATAATSCSSPRRAARSSWRSGSSASACASVSCATARCWRSTAVPWWRASAFGPTSRSTRATPSPPSARLPQAAQHADQLLTGREAARHEAGLALGGVPAAEVLDHGLRVHARAGVGGELPHRRGAPEPLRAVAQLGEDLLVGVALAD